MTVKVIGLIKLLNADAFEQYRSQVGATIERHQGRVLFRGAHRATFWNDLACGEFDACVDIEFPDEACMRAWAEGEDYARLLPIREQAMKLTLFAVA